MPGMQRQPGALTLSEHDRRVPAVWAADCAERAVAAQAQAGLEATIVARTPRGVRAFLISASTVCSAQATWFVGSSTTTVPTILSHSC
jgi:hypothetical protein